MISSPGFEAFTVTAIVFLGVALLSPSLLSLPVAETYRQTPDPVGWHGVCDKTGMEESNKNNGVQNATRIFGIFSPCHAIPVSNRYPLTGTARGALQLLAQSTNEEQSRVQMKNSPSGLIRVNE